jgi:hypothetical protein
MRHLLLPLTVLVNSLIFTAGFPSIASADIIPDGVSSVEYCFSITNLDRYPNYAFFSEVKSGRTNEVLDLQPIDRQGCYRVSGYRAYARVFARKKQPKVAPTSTKNRIYAKSNIDSVRYFESIYGVKKMRDGIKIKSISATELKLEYAEVIYTLNNGKQDRQPYLTQGEKPLPKATSSSLNLWYLVNSAAAVGIVAIFYRRFKLNRQQEGSASGDRDNSGDRPSC